MSKICEKVAEELGSNPDKMPAELAEHVKGCSECSASISALHALKTARKPLSAAEASSIAKISQAVLSSGPAATTIVTTNASTTGLVAKILVGALVIGASVLFMAGNDNGSQPDAATPSLIEQGQPAAKQLTEQLKNASSEVSIDGEARTIFISPSEEELNIK